MKVYLLVKCPSDQRRSVCEDAYAQILQRLTQLHTKPDIHSTITHLISMALEFPSCSPPPTNLAVQAQQHIGPPILFRKGRWSLTLRQQQEQFYCQQHRPVTYSGETWMCQILSLIFDQLYQIWQIFLRIEKGLRFMTCGSWLSVMESGIFPTNYLV